MVSWEEGLSIQVYSEASGFEWWPVAAEISKYRILETYVFFSFYSNIKCGCRWPIHPCLLCTGRQDPTAPRDLPDMLSRQERVALVDPCFHPILSFPDGKYWYIRKSIYVYIVDVVDHHKIYDMVMMRCNESLQITHTFTQMYTKQ